MKPRRESIAPFLAAVLTAAVGAVRPAAATTYVRMSDAELLDRSPTVVEGRVAAVEAAPGELPAIDYLVDVEGLLKGFVAGSSVIVRVPGGVRPDGVGLAIRGAPRFAEGEEVLLFLTPRHDGTYALHQLMLGAFHVELRGAEKVARRRLAGAEEFVVAGRPAGPADGRRDVEAFRSWLVDRAHGRARPADYFLPEEEDEDAAAAPEKFALVASTDEPPPFGCGATGGHNVRWFADEHPWPISWRYHADGQPGLLGGGLMDFQTALQSWGTDPNTPVQLIYLGRTRLTDGFLRQDDVNAVILEDPNDEIGGSFATSGLLAIGGPWFLCELESYAGEQFHPIVEAEIITQDGVSRYFESQAADPSLAAQELFAHELGHTLGLAHTPRRDALMRAVIHDDGRGASFDVDDLAGIFQLYGRPDIPIDPDGPPIPFLRPPRPPLELAATVAQYTQVELAWVDDSFTESNFRIERRGDGELDFRFVATVPSGLNRYVDRVGSESVYTYRVMAQNAAGRSLPSNLVRVETPHDPRPRPPRNLWTAAVSKFRMRLTWEDDADDETGFAIELQRQSAWVELPIELPADLTAVELLGLTPGTAFNFRIRSRNQFGDSEPSNESASTLFPVDMDCVSRDDVLCLGAGRLAVRVAYSGPGAGERPATVVPLTDEAGVFWFFGPGNPELLFRFLEIPAGDDPADPGHVEIVYTDASGVAYRITVTDAATGEVFERLHPAGGDCRAESRRFFFPKSTYVARRSRDLRALLARSERPELDLGALRPAPAGPTLAAAPETAACRRDDDTLCLAGGRFAAELGRIDALEPLAPRPARAFAGNGDSGYFSLDDPRQPDVLFKLLDGRAVNGRIWVFSSVAARDVSYRLAVTDTASGERRSYDQTAGLGCGVADAAAFAAP